MTADEPVEEDVPTNWMDVARTAIRWVCGAAIAIALVITAQINNGSCHR